MSCKSWAAVVVLLWLSPLAGAGGAKPPLAQPQPPPPEKAHASGEHEQSGEIAVPVHSLLRIELCRAIREAAVEVLSQPELDATAAIRARDACSSIIALATCWLTADRDVSLRLATLSRRGRDGRPWKIVETSEARLSSGGRSLRVRPAGSDVTYRLAFRAVWGDIDNSLEHATAECQVNFSLDTERAGKVVTIEWFAPDTAFLVPARGRYVAPAYRLTWEKETPGTARPAGTD